MWWPRAVWSQREGTGQSALGIALLLRIATRVRVGREGLQEWVRGSRGLTEREGCRSGSSSASVPGDGKFRGNGWLVLFCCVECPPKTTLITPLRDRCQALALKGEVLRASAAGRVWKAFGVEGQD